MRRIEQAAPELLGRTILALVGVEREADLDQLYIVFTDGSHYELFARSLGGAGRLHGSSLAEVLAAVTRSGPSARSFVVGST